MVHHWSNCICILQAGDRVFTTATVSGGYAEYAVADDDCVYHLPDALDFAQGSAIGTPYFTAYRAVVQKQEQPFKINHAAQYGEPYFKLKKVIRVMWCVFQSPY